MDYYPKSLEGSILLNNYFFGLQVAPGEFIPLRVLATNLFVYLFDPIGPSYNAAGANTPSFNTPIAPQSFIEPFRLGTTLNNVQDVFAVTREDTMYQLYFGFSPSELWFYKTNPFQTRLGVVENLPNVWGSTNPYFGFTRHSPPDAPSPATEVMVTQGNEFGPALYNPLPYAVAPVFNVWVNKLAVEVVRDPKIVARIAMGTFGTLKEVGGTEDVSAKVNTPKYFGIEPISTRATEAEIAAALGA